MKKSEPGYAWERQAFGGFCFATYETDECIDDIAIDFYGTDKGDVVSSAE